MKVQVKTVDSKALLKAFLSQVLTLTYAQHTIFCTMYIEELAQKKMVAQLYGNWFATCYNKLNPYPFVLLELLFCSSSCIASSSET
jgi:SHS2 domain-containing protein